MSGLLVGLHDVSKKTMKFVIQWQHCLINIQLYCDAGTKIMWRRDTVEIMCLCDIRKIDIMLIQSCIGT